ncbi:MAG: LysM peptidoglycan-binding domain-containing protein [Planctomycetes bacterium]|nr:LysM peptidoglycan-binding domain-containing protein [Planctomycetota bacterium]
MRGRLASRPVPLLTVLSIVVLLGGCTIPAASPTAFEPRHERPAMRGVPIHPDTAVVHIVERGDTLFSIARRHSVPVTELQRMNPALDPSHLEIGRRLLVPGKPRVRAIEIRGGDRLSDARRSRP